MPSTSRIDIRLTEEEKQKLKQQAEKLGLNASEYIRLIIALDASTEIIKRLGGKGK
jgi:predicted DNA binding CopG/RHH family protein